MQQLAHRLDCQRKSTLEICATVLMKKYMDEHLGNVNSISLKLTLRLKETESKPSPWQKWTVNIFLHYITAITLQQKKKLKGYENNSFFMIYFCFV